MVQAKQSTPEDMADGSGKGGYWGVGPSSALLEHGLSLGGNS